MLTQRSPCSVRSPRCNGPRPLAATSHWAGDCSSLVLGGWLAVWFLRQSGSLPTAPLTPRSPPSHTHTLHGPTPMAPALPREQLCNPSAPTVELCKSQRETEANMGLKNITANFHFLVPSINTILGVCPSIPPHPLYPSIHPPSPVSVHLSIPCPSVYPCPLYTPSIYPSIHPSPHTASIYLSIPQPLYLSIHPSQHTPNSCPSVPHPWLCPLSVSNPPPRLLFYVQPSPADTSCPRTP